MSPRNAFTAGFLAGVAFCAILVWLIMPAFASGHLPSCPDDRDACILEATAALEEGAPGLWTKGGKPRVAALRAVAGIKISAAERDAAWKQFPAWKAERGAVEQLETALAEMRADRDAQAHELLRARERVRDLEAALADTSRALRAANEDRRGAIRRTNRAAQDLSRAETKLKEMAAGVPVCGAERAVVAADDSWTARPLREKAGRLLACLELGGQ